MNLQSMWIDELASKMFHFNLLEIFWAKFHKIKIFTNIFVFCQSKHVQMLHLQELKNQVDEARQVLQKNIAKTGEKKCKRKTFLFSALNCVLRENNYYGNLPPSLRLGLTHLHPASGA